MMMLEFGKEGELGRKVGEAVGVTVYMCMAREGKGVGRGCKA